MSFKQINEWGLRLLPHGQLLIAGPCSAESEEQVLATARELKGSGAGLIRAGVWKPRTHPGTFEGVGEAAFAWLEAMQAETGLPFGVEVANAKHVELALAHGAGAVWVGARTTVTPFAVQEIAEALRGTDVPVLVKNPLNPDLELWLGALERLGEAGVTRLAAVLRGVGGVAPGAYRNAPGWSLALELRHRLPGLPCLCDPSHIAGDAQYVGEVAQQALNLGFEGLMVEAHIHPEAALSDGRQQLTPSALTALIGRLEYRTSGGASTELQQRLAACRLEIDQLDVSLVSLLARRMDVSRQIGELKKSEKLTVLQSARWEQVLGRAVELGGRLGLSREFIEDVFNRIHLESIARQQ